MREHNVAGDSLTEIIDGRATGELAGDWSVLLGVFLVSFVSDTDAGPSTCKADAGATARAHSMEQRRRDQGG